MMQETEPAEMLHKFDGDPDGNELPGHRYQLKEKPNCSVHFPQPYTRYCR